MEHALLIRSGTVDDLIELYPEYALTFPEEERKSLSDLHSLLDLGDYKLLLACSTDSGQRMGYAFLLKLKDTGMLWLDFLAVSRAVQSSGIGGQIFRYITEEHRFKWDGMLLEVERPSGEDPNQDRRIVFYERLGARCLPVEYRLPTEDGGLPMNLFFYPLANETLSEEALRGTVRQALTRIHGDIAMTEAIILRFEEGLARQGLTEV